MNIKKGVIIKGFWKYVPYLENKKYWLEDNTNLEDN